MSCASACDGYTGWRFRRTSDDEHTEIVLGTVVPDGRTGVRGEGPRRLSNGRRDRPTARARRPAVRHLARRMPCRRAGCKVWAGFQPALPDPPHVRSMPMTYFLPRHVLTWLACETAHASGNRPLLLLFPGGHWAGWGFRFDWESSIH